jgi:hypothetical protein
MKKIYLGVLVAVLVTLGFGLLSAASASASTESCDPYGPSCVTPQLVTTTTVPDVTTTTAPAQVEALTVTAAPAATTAAAAPASTTPSSSLAFTGGDIGGLVAIGLCLVGLGLVVVRTSRRRATD